MELPGLPEGLEAVRWGMPADDEWVLQYGTIVQAKRVKSSLDLSDALIVVPKSGYAIRWDIRENDYRVIRVLPAPLTVRALFRIDSEDRLVYIKEALQKISEFVCFES